MSDEKKTPKLWVPSTITEATIDASGNMTMLDKMTFELKPIGKPGPKT